jgi:hypothetical protein
LTTLPVSIFFAKHLKPFTIFALKTFISNETNW